MNFIAMGEFCPLSKTFSSKCLQGQNLLVFYIESIKDASIT